MTGKFLFFAFILYMLTRLSQQNLEDDIKEHLRKENATFRSLSRKRRYLLFPDGSSFQLVFCLTYPSVGGGQIFVYGSTAALAWQLPSEPSFFEEKKKYLKGKKKPTTPPPPPPPELPHHDEYMPWDAWQPQVPDQPVGDAYHGAPSDDADAPAPHGPPEDSPPSRKGYYNPFQDQATYSRKQSWSERKSPTYDGSARYGGGVTRNSVYTNNPVNSYLHPVFHEIHRRTRRELYGKIEKLFTALSRDGRACLLKAICEVNKGPKGKGTFMEEIIKVIFRAKPHDNYPTEDEYDVAANLDHDCDTRYPTCEGSIWSSMFMMNNK